MKYAAVFFIALLVACSDRKEPTPEGVLEPVRFQEVLLESQLIEARMNHELVISRVASIPGSDYYSEMFKEKGVTKDEFDRSFAFYSGQPDLMKGMYEAIITELVQRKDRLPQ